MDAIKFLLKEHNKIRKTFTKIKSKSRETTKHKMFDFLCKDLVRHEKMEQKIWYPYLKKNTPLKNKIKHLLKEEKTAAKVIKEFKKIKNPEKWEKKFLAFKKDVSHHANEEETKLFPKVKKSLENSELKLIGEQFHAYKNKHTNHYL